MSAGSHRSNDFSSMNKSIPELITFLRYALKESHFKEVENILVEREEKAKLEIEKLTIENEVLRKKCEVLSLDFGGIFSGKNGDGERERSAEEIYDQLVGEMVGGKGEKTSDEFGRLTRENDELKRQNVKLSKFVLDCVENYVEWSNKFSSLQREVRKVKSVEVVGLDGISKDRSGEYRENREGFIRNDDNRLLFGKVCRVLDFDVDENDPVGVAPAKEKENEVLVDQGSRIAPVKRGREIIDVDDDLPRATCEGNMASRKPIDREDSNQSYVSKGKKRKSYSCTNVVDLEKDPNPTNGIGRLDIQTDGEYVNKDKESIQKITSPLKVSPSAAGEHVNEGEESTQKIISPLKVSPSAAGEHVNGGEESTQKIISPLKVSPSAASAPGVPNAENVTSQHNVGALRHCDGSNVKKRRLLEQLEMSISKVAQTYNNEDISCSYLSADGPKKRRQWKFFANMCADLSIDDKVCLSAVCALYRQQKFACENTECSIRPGFTRTSLERAIQLAEFLIDGDPESRLNKTEKELQSQFAKGLEDCRDIAREHSKQLFEIYQKKLDAFYPEA